MSVWQISEMAAWVISAAIALFMIGDAILVSMRYDEEFLTHSLEDPLTESRGADADPAPGGQRADVSSDEESSRE